MKTKKQLKAEYKNLKPEMGVFQVRNTLNGKIMISNALNINAKFNRYRAQLNLGMHRNKNLQKEWDKYGENNFVFEILSVLEHNDKEPIDYQAELDVLQDMALNELDGKQDFY